MQYFSAWLAGGRLSKTWCRGLWRRCRTWVRKRRDMWFQKGMILIQGRKRAALSTTFDGKWSSRDDDYNHKWQCVWHLGTTYQDYAWVTHIFPTEGVWCYLAPNRYFSLFPTEVRQLRGFGATDWQLSAPATPFHAHFIPATSSSPSSASSASASSSASSAASSSAQLIFLFKWWIYDKSFNYTISLKLRWVVKKYRWMVMYTVHCTTVFGSSKALMVFPPALGQG